MVKRGSIQWFSQQKGYGFISPDEEEALHFVHRADLNETDSLKKGTRVEYKVIPGHNGPKAVGVRLI